ncbi:MAG: hypothetical protein AB1921_08170 [Thermodesulfobacteriota bacterium]
MIQYAFGDPAYLSKNFLFMTLLGLFSGGIVCAGFIFPQLRKREFRESGSMKKTGIVMGGGIFLVFAFAGYWVASHRFTRLDFDSGKVALAYHWPGRTRSVACGEIRMIDFLKANAKTGTLSLAIMRKDGSVLKSAPVSRWDFSPLWKEMQQTVCAER